MKDAIKRVLTLLLTCFMACAFLAGCFYTESSNNKPAAKKSEKENPKELKKLPSSFQVLKELAESGKNVRAMYELGAAYERGMYAGDMSVPQDTSKALKWLLKAAENGHARAAHRAVWSYHDELGNEKALQLLKRADEKVARSISEQIKRSESITHHKDAPGK